MLVKASYMMYPWFLPEVRVVANDFRLIRCNGTYGQQHEVTPAALLHHWLGGWYMLARYVGLSHSRIGKLARPWFDAHVQRVSATNSPARGTPVRVGGGRPEQGTSR